MKKIMNVALLLCAEYDEELMNIDGIFNVIKMEDGRASFTVVTVINNIEYPVDRFVLLLFIVNVKEEKQLYIGSEQFEKKPELEDGSELKSSIFSDTAHHISKMDVENIKFLSSGEHQFLVYKYEQDDIDRVNKMLQEGKEYELADDNNLIATYEFTVTE